MANLWRAMALAWLGGLASPFLIEDATIIDDSPPPAVASDFQASESRADSYEIRSDFDEGENARTRESGSRRPERRTIARLADRT
jgi:hypothetical protein